MIGGPIGGPIGSVSELLKKIVFPENLQGYVFTNSALSGRVFGVGIDTN